MTSKSEFDLTWGFLFNQFRFWFEGQICTFAWVLSLLGRYFHCT